MLLALKCFQAWLALDVTGGGSALLSAGQLYSQHRQLFEGLLSALSSLDGAVLRLAAESLALVLGLQLPPSLPPHDCFRILIGLDITYLSYMIHFPPKFHSVEDELMLDVLGHKAGTAHGCGWCLIWRIGNCDHGGAMVSENKLGRGVISTTPECFLQIEAVLDLIHNVNIQATASGQSQRQG